MNETLYIILMAIFTIGACIGIALYTVSFKHTSAQEKKYGIITFAACLTVEHGPVKSDDTVYGKLDEFHSLGPSPLTASIIEKYKLSCNDTAEDIMRAINELRTGEEKKG